MNMAATFGWRPFCKGMTPPWQLTTSLPAPSPFMVAQFAGSSSVPAHVDMMGLIGMGNNPMVGATVACAVAVNAAINE